MKDCFGLLSDRFGLLSDRFGLLLNDLVLTRDGCFEGVATLFEALNVEKQGGRVHDNERITISKKLRQRNTEKIDSY